MSSACLNEERSRWLSRSVCVGGAVAGEEGAAAEEAAAGDEAGTAWTNWAAWAKAA